MAGEGRTGPESGQEVPRGEMLDLLPSRAPGPSTGPDTNKPLLSRRPEQSPEEKPGTRRMQKGNCRKRKAFGSLEWAQDLDFSVYKKYFLLPSISSF